MKKSKQKLISVDWNIKAKQWCWANGIKISPFPINSTGSHMKINIVKNGSDNVGEKIFTPEDIYAKINELYTTIYNRHQKAI